MHAAKSHGSPGINFTHYDKPGQHARAANKALFLWAVLWVQESPALLGCGCSAMH